MAAVSSIENNFTKGLVTEFTGLNFPENAATDTANCTYTLVGDVVRREGIDWETNYKLNTVDRTNKAITTYQWNNVGGDGSTQFLVEQIGGTLYFYNITASSVISPISTQKLATSFDMTSFQAPGAFDITAECQFTDGNGYLFVFHPSANPAYITYAGGVLTLNGIGINIRDFVGISESFADNYRPGNLAQQHLYNLVNQGWSQGNPWAATSTTSNIYTTGGLTWTIQAGLTIANGQTVVVNDTSPNPLGVKFGPNTGNMVGTVTSYSGTSLTISISNFTLPPGGAGSSNSWTFTPTNTGYINTWFSAVGVYPSNADQWWSFKNTSGAFDPATTLSHTTISAGPAPKGSVILNAFHQERTIITGVTGITNIVTLKRPQTGTWFQGRVWYTGVNDSVGAAGDAAYTTWTENIYFSQIVKTPADFGKCYQTNDPTSETLFSLLPTDGGVITIQGSGPIYKLFPLQNALLVFAANGVWYITGSQGIGFSAEDYTIVKLSAVKSISSTSIVDVQGLPMFWNEEGIYSVEPAKQGTSLLNSPLHVNPLEVTPLTVGTILTFYSNIPLQSKKYVHGAYNPIDYVIQWVYKSTNEVSVTDRYTYDSILNFNTANKAFYPHTLDISNPVAPSINSIVYVSSPGGSGAAVSSVIKYVSSNTTGTTFADEHDPNCVDWASSTSTNYVSFFVTGYKLHGQGQRRFQVPYLYVFSRSVTPTSYKIQGLWDYATTGDSGRWSVAQLINNWAPNFGMMFRRHVLRGRGLVLQIKITSVDGKPFDILGWSTYETQNPGV